MAEFEDIARVTALHRTLGCGDRRVPAKFVDQRQGVGQRGPAGNENILHSLLLTARAFGDPHKRRQRFAYHAALATFVPAGHGPAMVEKRRNAVSGGIFLFLGAMIGLLYGIGRGDPSKWLLVGFVIGLAVAIGVWLVDRRRDRS